MAPFRISRKVLAQRIRGLRRVPETRREPAITSAALHALEVDLVLYDRRTCRELPPELQLTKREGRGPAKSPRDLADELVRLADRLRRQSRE